MRRCAFLAALLCVLGWHHAARAMVPTQEEPIAILRALDKITARVEELNIPIGEPYKFGTIIISVRACRVTPPEDTPEAAAFLEVSELKPGEPDKPVFRGWMFASSPALSAMEHPVYDIWVIGCKGPPDSTKTAAPTTDQPPAGTLPPAAPPTPSPAAPAPGAKAK
jgi:hypothetical protein